MFDRFFGLIAANGANGIVERTFRALPISPLPFDPAGLATRLVGTSYRTKPDLFDGKHGKRPHSVATAAVSLAGGLSFEEYGFGSSARTCVFLSLGNVLLDASANARRYGFSQIDLRLLSLAETAYLEHEKKTREATSAILNDILP